MRIETRRRLLHDRVEGRGAGRLGAGRSAAMADRPPMSARAPKRLWRPPSRYAFPDAETGTGREGLIGIGADFAPGTILAAYHKGIFPWPAPELGVVVWCSPDPRAIFPMNAAPHW